MNISNILGLTIPEGKVVANREACTVTFIKTSLGNQDMLGGVYYFDKKCELQFLDLPDSNFEDSVTIEVLKDSLMVQVCDYNGLGCFEKGTENITPLWSIGFDDTGFDYTGYSSTAAIINGDATINI